jgi:16S rRNA (uracil1498-N3)-methyltransferase
MRRTAGDPVLLFNGRHGEWRGRIDLLGKGRMGATVERQTRLQRGGADLWLLIAPLKRGPMDLVVEKATELGASAIWPVSTRRTVVGRLNADRARQIMIGAAEQCGRLDVPRLVPSASLDAALGEWPAGRRLMLCDESREGPPVAEALGALGDADRRAPWAVLVGPEGGFERSELDALKKLAFVTPVALGQQVLRAETAAVAAVACWQALIGAWARPYASDAV